MASAQSALESRVLALVGPSSDRGKWGIGVDWQRFQISGSILAQSSRGRPDAMGASEAK